MDDGGTRAKAVTPAELVARHKHILLDFDGPVCAVFGGELGDREAADELKRLVGGDLPDSVAAAHDPFDVLRYANTLGDVSARAVEARFRALEVEAVSTAPETQGTRATIEKLVSIGHLVAIVSNNSAAAVRRYVDTRRWADLITFVSAREPADVDMLKPNPYLLTRAIDKLEARTSTCVMIGDSTTDVDAAHAAGVAVVGYANKPGKRELLHSAGADTSTEDLRELA